MRTAASTVLVGFLLCLYLHQSLGQRILPSGHDCSGFRSDMCMPGTICQADKCRLERGHHGCTGRLCVLGLTCFNDTCKDLNLCTEPGEMCTSELVCDPLTSSCKKMLGLRRKYYCRSSEACVSGASCIRRQSCKCNKGIAKSNGTTCAPMAGKVGGRCLTGKRCDDLNATCKRRKCQCNDGFAVNGPDLTCKLAERKAGESCADQSSVCVSGTICDTDHICRILPRGDCSGKKEELCQSGLLCIKGSCYAQLGQSCSPVSYYSHTLEPCAEGSTCDTTRSSDDTVCGIPYNHDCRDNPGLCANDETNCDYYTRKCKKRVLYGGCTTDSECGRWASCNDVSVGVCICRHSQMLTWSGGRYCAMPKGIEGAPCNSSKDCTDKRAKCDMASGLCKCRPGYTVNLHTGACELMGAKCSIKDRGYIDPFFPDEIKFHRGLSQHAYKSRLYSIVVGLPCSFKAANFKCGNAEVQVYGHVAFGRTNVAKLKNFIAGVTVNITTQTGAERTFQTYTLVKPNDTESWEWQTTCKDGQCVGQDDVKLSVKSRSGIAMLRKRLLNVTYLPERKSPFQGWRRPVLPSQLLIECGHSNFRSLQRYPDVLCGSTKDSVKDVENFNRELQLELMNENLTAFAFLPPNAFSVEHQSDHAVLRRQHVPHIDPMCQEAADIVTGDCPAVAEKMYNCSRLFEDDTLYISSYTRPNCEKIDLMKLYSSCLRVMCGRVEDRLDEICQTLQQALDVGCDTRSGFLARITDASPKVTEIADLLQMAGCPPADSA